MLFADLVNFTAWSASVAPERVFVVLEAVFRGWDAAAARCGVYKARPVPTPFGLALGALASLLRDSRLAAPVVAAAGRDECASAPEPPPAAAASPLLAAHLPAPGPPPPPVGDCWMGITGVPTTSETHAADLARLAVALSPLLDAACEQLGVAPGLLRARVGLHSGPVTAGIIRADRARYQVFGARAEGGGSG